MAKNNYELNPTTVRLTEKAQAIKEDLVPVFGLKNILSAGLVLLNELADTDQKRVIAKANNIGKKLDITDFLNPETLLKIKQIELSEIIDAITQLKEQEKTLKQKRKKSTSTAQQGRLKRELVEIHDEIRQLSKQQEATAKIFTKLLDETYLRSIAGTLAPQEPLKVVKPIQ